MKHTETTLRFPVNELTVGGSTTECTNLRFSDAGTEGVSALIPTRGLTPTAPGGLIPLGRICLPDTGGDVLLLATADRCADGFHELIVITAEGDITVHRTSAIIYCAVAEGSGWLVMTSAGHITVRCGATLADCSATTSTTAPPVISLTAIDCGTISRPVETLALTDTDFSRDTPALSPSGARQLSKALISAYSAIASGATENDAWFQPLLARFRLLNADGHTLYTSEPQLITSRGWQCTSLITFEGSKSGSTLSLHPLQLEADIYSIRAEIHSLGGYADTAKTVEISVTPQLHPADFSAEAPYRIVRPSTDSPALTTAIPGATASLADDSPARARSLLDLMARLDLSEYKIAAITATAGTSQTVTNTLRTPALKEIRAISSILAKSLTIGSVSPSATASKLLRSISAPHSFTARQAVMSGDTVLWADITPLPAPAALPYRRPSASPDTETPEWAGTLRVTFADGHILDTSIGYPMPLPQTLPALVSYPDPEAIRLEIWTDCIDTGDLRYGVAALAPSEDGTRAVALNPSLAPTPLSPWTAGTYPAATTDAVSTGRRYPGAVVSAATGEASQALGIIEVTPSTIVALHPAVRSQSSWDFTRNRFYALAPSGIFAVACGSDRSRIHSSLLDPRGIAHHSLSAYTDAGVMAVAHSGQLLRVSASGARVAASDVSVTALAWDAAVSRVLMLRPDGLVEAIHTDTLSRCFIDTLPRPSALYDLGGRPLAATTTALYTTASAVYAMTHIRWSARIAIGRIGNARLLAVGMAASTFNGTVTLTTDSGPGHAGAATLLKLTVSGAVNAPLTARLTGIIRPFVAVTIEADVSSDFRLTRLQLIYK